MLDALSDWYVAMTCTIWGILLAGLAAMSCGLVGALLDSDAWFIAAMLVGQIGTALALGIGFLLDRRRMRAKAGSADG